MWRLNQAPILSAMRGRWLIVLGVALLVVAFMLWFVEEVILLESASGL